MVHKDTNDSTKVRYENFCNTTTDLNPVELMWKTIKREVSMRFIKSKEQLKYIIKNEFTRMENSLSYLQVNGWKHSISK